MVLKYLIVCKLARYEIYLFILFNYKNPLSLLVLACKDKDKDLTGKDKDKDLFFVLKDTQGQGQGLTSLVKTH